MTWDGAQEGIVKGQAEATVWHGAEALGYHVLHFNVSTALGAFATVYLVYYWSKQRVYVDKGTQPRVSYARCDLTTAKKK